MIYREEVEDIEENSDWKCRSGTCLKFETNFHNLDGFSMSRLLYQLLGALLLLVQVNLLLLQLVLLQLPLLLLLLLMLLPTTTYNYSTNTTTITSTVTSTGLVSG